MLKIAFIFPGQGSQKVGMGKELTESFTMAKEVFQQTNQILGFDMEELCYNGPEEELKKTFNTQPAIFTHSLACLEVLKSQWNITPSVTAGHSSGEYAALVAAGALSFADALKLIHLRGKAMWQAGIEEKGTMAAVIGLATEVINELCLETEGIVQIANINSPNQLVISGEEKAVKEVQQKCTAKGAKKVIPLVVSGAFHSPLMQKASEMMAGELEKAVFQQPFCPVCVNVTASYVQDKETIRENLIKQITSPVRWEESLTKMAAEGVDTFIELGPGNVLSGLVKRTLSKQINILNVEDLASLQKTGSFLEKNLERKESLCLS